MRSGQELWIEARDNTEHERQTEAPEEPEIENLPTNNEAKTNARRHSSRCARAVRAEMSA